MTNELREAQTATIPFAMYWGMIEAHNELAGEPLKDDAVALRFMGSGASTQVTVGQIRKMLDVIYQCEDGYPIPKHCEICNGKKGGVPGNNVIINGKRVCDYCHADGSYNKDDPA